MTTADAPRELAGQVAIVTGATRNIGRAIALELAQAGAIVVVNARSVQADADAVAQEIELAGGRAMPYVADVTDAASVAALTRAAVHAFDRIDILVNNAAQRSEVPFDAMSLGDWHRCLAVVLDGAFLCARACLPAMHACGRGTIVNIGGLTGHTGAKNRAHVVTAKAGLVGFTRALAHDLADDHITVNCVSPGLIQTRRAGPAPAHQGERRTLAGRVGLPEDVAGVVRMLCGPRGRYITGQTLHVNGGLYLG